jgi:hypothetical protein
MIYFHLQRLAMPQAPCVIVNMIINVDYIFIFSHHNCFEISLSVVNYHGVLIPSTIICVFERASFHVPFTNRTSHCP